MQSQHQGGSGFILRGELGTTEKTSLEKSQEKTLDKPEQSLCQGRGPEGGQSVTWEV